MGGGDQRIFAARHVAADRGDRDVLVAEDDAGQRLDLDVAERLLLDLGEVADLGLGELDVLEVARRQLDDAAGDLALAQPEGRRRPVVELR